MSRIRSRPVPFSTPPLEGWFVVRITTVLVDTPWAYEAEEWWNEGATDGAPNGTGPWKAKVGGRQITTDNPGRALPTPFLTEARFAVGDFALARSADGAGGLTFELVPVPVPGSFEAKLTTSSGGKWKLQPLRIVAGVEAAAGTETANFCATPYAADDTTPATSYPHAGLRVRVWPTGEVIAGVVQYEFDSHWGYASSTQSGVVSTVAQHFAGNKTFDNDVSVLGNESVLGDLFVGGGAVVAGVTGIFGYYVVRSDTSVSAYISGGIPGTFVGTANLVASSPFVGNGSIYPTGASLYQCVTTVVSPRTFPFNHAAWSVTDLFVSYGSQAAGYLTGMDFWVLFSDSYLPTNENTPARFIVQGSYAVLDGNVTNDFHDAVVRTGLTRSINYTVGGSGGVPRVMEFVGGILVCDRASGGTCPEPSCSSGSPPPPPPPGCNMSLTFWGSDRVSTDISVDTVATAPHVHLAADEVLVVFVAIMNDGFSGPGASSVSFGGRTFSSFNSNLTPDGMAAVTVWVCDHPGGAVIIDDVVVTGTGGSGDNRGLIIQAVVLSDATLVTEAAANSLAQGDDPDTEPSVGPGSATVAPCLFALSAIVMASVDSGGMDPGTWTGSFSNVTQRSGVLPFRNYTLAVGRRALTASGVALQTSLTGITGGTPGTIDIARWAAVIATVVGDPS